MCAGQVGLILWGMKRLGPLHRYLLEKDPRRIYESWLAPSSEIDDPQAASGEELFEFILGIPEISQHFRSKNCTRLPLNESQLTRLLGR